MQTDQNWGRGNATVLIVSEIEQAYNPSGEHESAFRWMYVLFAHQFSICQEMLVVGLQDLESESFTLKQMINSLTLKVKL